MLRPSPTGREQHAVGHLVYGTITADGHYTTGTRADRARRELDAVSGTIRALGFHAPALAPKLAHDRIERARRRTTPGGGIEDDVGMDQRLIISIEARSGSGIGPRGGSAAVLGYDRVTVYCPQAVNWTVTFEVTPFRDTVAIRVPESKRGSTVQLALKCSAGLVVTASA